MALRNDETARLVRLSMLVGRIDILEAHIPSKEGEKLWADDLAKTKAELFQQSRWYVHHLAGNN